MDKLTLADASFLYLETSNSPMHVAGLQHLEVPPGEEETYFDALKEHLRERLHRVPFLTRRLAWPPLGLDHPVWVDDDRFDLDHHVRRLRLPPPGNQRQLEATVARLHERPLDRSRPLWEMWLIDGLESGAVVLYSKYHHACIDGVAGQELLGRLFTPTPEPEPVPPRVTAAPTERPSLLSVVRDSAWSAVTQPMEQMRILPRYARSAWNLGSRALTTGLGALGSSAPRTRFNVAVGPYRSYAVGSLPLGAMKAVGKPQGCTVNDVFMAVCAGGLRSYLAERGELPERPLLAGAPVSVRRPEEPGFGNQVSMLSASLETHRTDPVERMRAIRDSAAIGKDVVAELVGLGVGELSTPGLPWALQGTAALFERLRLGDLLPLPVNLVISNVHGPRRTMYLKGARLLSHYPVSIPAHGAALNITVQSYCDRMDFSLTACLDAVPDAARLREHFVRAWEELHLAATGEPAPASPGLHDPVRRPEPASAPEKAA